MKATIITIGDEILIGQIVDTNSAWIAARLNETGIRVVEKATVGDDAAEITAIVDRAFSRSDLVVVTGGLGPTKDDITKTTLALYFGCGLVRHEATYRHIEKMLTTRGIQFNGLNRAQAMVPECCTVLHNELGTAPGMWFEQGGKVLASLPGVPFEMKALVDEQLLPMVRRKFRLGDIAHRTVLTFGIAESLLAETIAPWEDALPHDLHLAYLPNPSYIRLRLSAYDGNGAAAEIDKRFAELQKLIPDFYVGDYDSVAHAVGDTLTRHNKTLAVAESCTGGAVSTSFTAISGASKYFLGSVVSYSNDVKTDILGVSRDDLAQYGAVSRQVAAQMAEGVRKLCGSDYAIATTGIAGPDGGTPEKPVGTVWIAVATPDGTVEKRLTLGGRREQIIARSAAAAINLLRLTIK